MWMVNALLFVLEYLLKITAGVTSIVVLGAAGSFFGKLGTGFGSLSDVYRDMTAWPETLSYTGAVIDDYNTMTAANFNQQYGGQAVNSVMESLNEWVAYFQAVYGNLTQQPLATLAATVIAFLFFYLIARTVRFVRQRGRGSWIVRRERELGDRVFRGQKEHESVYSDG